MSTTMACPQASVTATALGPVEFHLTAGDGPVVLASHGGMGGADQARLLLTWLGPSAYRLLSASRPGYLSTPLEGRETPERQGWMAAEATVITVPACAVPAGRTAPNGTSRVAVGADSVFQPSAGEHSWRRPGR